MTECNLCLLNAIKRRHKQSGMRVLTRKSNFIMKGVDVYVMPRGKCLPYNGIPDEIRSQYWVCWIGEVPKRCAC